MTNITKSIRSTFTLGVKELSCFQRPDGSRFLSQSEVCRAVNKPAKRMVELLESKKGQALIDKGFEKGLEKEPVVNSKPITPVTLEQATTFWALELSIGNLEALALVTACSTETLERRVDRAFGVTRTEFERDDLLRQRHQAFLDKSRVTRRAYTDILKDKLIEQFEPLRVNQRLYP